MTRLRRSSPHAGLPKGHNTRGPPMLVIISDTRKDAGVHFDSFRIETTN